MFKAQTILVFSIFLCLVLGSSLSPHDKQLDTDRTRLDLRDVLPPDPYNEFTATLSVSPTTTSSSTHNSALPDSACNIYFYINSTEHSGILFAVGPGDGPCLNLNASYISIASNSCNAASFDMTLYEKGNCSGEHALWNALENTTYTPDFKFSGVSYIATQ